MGLYLFLFSGYTVGVCTYSFYWKGEILLYRALPGTRLLWQHPTKTGPRGPRNHQMNNRWALHRAQKGQVFPIGIMAQAQIHLPPARLYVLPLCLRPRNKGPDSSTHALSFNARLSPSDNEFMGQKMGADYRTIGGPRLGIRWANDRGQAD